MSNWNCRVEGEASLEEEREREKYIYAKEGGTFERKKMEEECGRAS